VIEINLFGAFYCAREALKRMVPQKSGVVLSTTSVHEEIAWSGYSAYTSSKAAISMLTRLWPRKQRLTECGCWRLVPGPSKRRSTARFGTIHKHEKIDGENPAETNWRAG